MPEPLHIERATEPADLADRLRVANAAVPMDAFPLEELLHEVAIARERLDLVARRGGEAVGAASISRDDGGDWPQAGVWVLERERRRGIGSALVAELSAWAAERGARGLHGDAYEAHPDGLAYFLRRGYREVGREHPVLLDLRGLAPPAIDPPAGIEIVPYAERPDATAEMYEVACEAIPDIPAEEPEQAPPFEDWLERDLGRPAFPPEATFLALAGGRVVGYAMLGLPRPGVGWHSLTGVRRAWRGRGIAGALKRAQVAWAIGHGLTALQTDNEERNAPIRRLNERLGYRPLPDKVQLRGPLLPAP